MILRLGDCLDLMSDMADNSVDVIITSPPYNKKGLIGKVTPGNQVWKKFNIDYNSYGDDLNEKDYQQWMIDVLNEMKRVIKPDGSIFFNHKPRRHKNRVHLPTDFIMKSELRLYQMIIWDRRSSPNIRKDVLLPCTEHIYWLSKGKPKVYKDQIDPKYQSEVWVMNPQRGSEHPAPFPEVLVETCMKLTTKEGDVVMDPFLGSGTAGLVAQKHGREFIGFEIDEHYMNIAKKSLNVK